MANGNGSMGQAGPRADSQNGRKAEVFRPLDRQELQELINLDVQAIALDVQR